MSKSIDAAALCGAFEQLPAKVGAFLSHYLGHWAPYKPGWVYEDGVVWKGALELFQASDVQLLEDFVITTVSPRVADDGTLFEYRQDEYNIDNICAGKVLFPLYRTTGEIRYRKAIDKLMAQLELHPRTHSGNYWHKQIYPWQVWLDGLYMAQPFLVEYALSFGRDELLIDVRRQFEQVGKVLRDPDTGLYQHGWDESRQEQWSNAETGCSAHFWARAMGWFLVAMADILELVKGCAVASDFEPLRLQFRDAVDAVIRQRTPGGLWLQVMDQPGRDGNYEETSASLMFADALMKGVRIGVLDAAAGEVGAQALASIIQTRLEPNELSGICGVAGLGNTPYRDGSYDYYIGEKQVPNDPKGVGALMMALGERLRR